MSAKRVDHTGQKYHHLSMLYPTRSGGGGVGMFWMSQCDCGALKEIRASEAKKGYIKTCGKCEYHSGLLKEAASKSGQNKDPKRPLREAYARYASDAIVRKLDWKLTPEQFEEIIKQNCIYCDAPPREYHRKVRKGKGASLKLVRNGIDRVDNQKGYTLDNVVTCCFVCNKMKGSMRLLDFVKHTHRISTKFKELVADV